MFRNSYLNISIYISGQSTTGFCISPDVERNDSGRNLNNILIQKAKPLYKLTSQSLHVKFRGLGENSKFAHFKPDHND